MHSVIFRDAAGKEIFRAEDHSRTLVPVTKEYAAASAMAAFNHAVGSGLISPQAAQSVASLDVSHGYGRNRVAREEAERIFQASPNAPFETPPAPGVVMDHCWLPDAIRPLRV